MDSPPPGRSPSSDFSRAAFLSSSSRSLSDAASASAAAARPADPLHIYRVCQQDRRPVQHTRRHGGRRGQRSGDPRPLFGRYSMAELVAQLHDFDGLDRVLTASDLSELEPPSKKKKTGDCSSENEGGVDDRSNDDGRTTCWVWSDDCSWAACPVRSPSSENEGGVDDSRNNDDGRTTCWVWPDDNSWAACLLPSPSSENEGGVDDSRSNGDPHELGQRALPFSGKESNEINGVEGSREVRSVARKCPVRHPKAVQLLSASSSNSDYLDVNLRMEGRHPPPLLLWLSDRLSGSIRLPNVGIILGNLKPENVLKTDRSFRAQLAYIKKNNMDVSLVKSTPDAEDLFSHLRKKNPRLEAREALLHPFSWSSKVKLLFLREMYEILVSKNLVPDQELLYILESFDENWIEELDPELKDYIIQRPEDYDYRSVMDLVRCIRNISIHRHGLPGHIKKQVGSNDEEIYNYFATRFPSLFMKFYGAAIQFCRKDGWFKKFQKEFFPEFFGRGAL